MSAAFWSCADVLQEVLGYLPLGLPLRNAQMSCRAIYDAFTHIEPSAKNVATIATHKVRSMECRSDAFAVDGLAAARELMAQLHGAVAGFENQLVSLMGPDKATLDSGFREVNEMVECEIAPRVARGRASMQQLCKMDIAEVRAFANPPPVVVFAAGLTLQILNVRIGASGPWVEFRRLIADPAFHRRTIEFEVEDLASRPKSLAALKPMFTDPLFDLDRARMVSKFYASLFVWAECNYQAAVRLREIESARRLLDELRVKHGAHLEVRDALKKLAKRAVDAPRKSLLLTEQRRRERIIKLQDSTRGIATLVIEEGLARSRLVKLEHFDNLRGQTEDLEAALRAAMEERGLGASIVTLQGEELRGRCALLLECREAARQLPRPPTKVQLRNMRPAVQPTSVAPPQSLGIHTAAGSTRTPRHLEALLRRSNAAAGGVALPPIGKGK